jgi:hypothetical protein
MGSPVAILRTEHAPPETLDAQYARDSTRGTGTMSSQPDSSATPSRLSLASPSRANRGGGRSTMDGDAPVEGRAESMLRDGASTISTDERQPQIAEIEPSTPDLAIGPASPQLPTISRSAPDDADESPRSTAPYEIVAFGRSAAGTRQRPVVLRGEPGCPYQVTGVIRERVPARPRVATAGQERWFQARARALGADAVIGVRQLPEYDLYGRVVAFTWEALAVIFSDPTLCSPT